MKMTPQQKIKHLIIIKDHGWSKTPVPELTAKNIDEYYDSFLEEDEWHFQNAEGEAREGEVETGIACSDSRLYKLKSVASQACDGSWVGWTYWYDGGKYGRPEDIDWQGKAYNLEVTEKEKVVTIREFKKAEV